MDYLFTAFLSIILTVSLFLLLRSLFLWYWKVNIIIANQEKQIELLTRLVSGSSNDIESKARKYDEANR